MAGNRGADTPHAVVFHAAETVQTVNQGLRVGYQAKQKIDASASTLAYRAISLYQ